MATAQEDKREEFYAKVRKRTADQWRKTYVTTNPRNEEEAKKLLESLKRKPESVYSINNVLWLLASIGVFYVTDFALVLLYDRRVNRFWLQTGAGFLLLALLCALYCIVWLSCIKKIRSDKWEDHNPFVIPVATVSMLAGGVLVCCSVWPVWSVLTIPIVGIEIMGFIVFIAMIPDII